MAYRDDYEALRIKVTALQEELERTRRDDDRQTLARQIELLSEELRAAQAEVAREDRWLKDIGARVDAIRSQLPEQPARVEEPSKPSGLSHAGKPAKTVPYVAVAGAVGLAAVFTALALRDVRTDPPLSDSPSGVPASQLPGGVRAFEPMRGLEIARSLGVPELADLVRLELSAVKSDGTVDLEAGGSVRYVFGIADEGGAPGTAHPGTEYEVQVGPAGMQSTGSVLEVTGLFQHAPLPVPACPPASAWQTARSHGVPAEAVAVMRLEPATSVYEGVGEPVWRFSVLGSPTLQIHAMTCELVRPLGSP